MKLALIRRQFSATSGAELYLQRLLGMLAERGHELHLFTESWEAAPAGVTLHPLRIRASRARRPLAFSEAVRHELAGQSFDCIFSLERTRRQDVYRCVKIDCDCGDSENAVEAQGHTVRCLSMVSDWNENWSSGRS